MASPITTAEELLRAGDVGRCELVRGELRRLIPPGAQHGRIAMNVTGPVLDHVRTRRLGTLFAAETGFLLSRSPDTVRAPDLAFVRAGRPPAPPRGYYPGAPDLAVEVLSPDDRPGYVREKVAEWLESGARAVWVVDPARRTVTVHETAKGPCELSESDTLGGGAVLPGFEVPVSEIFA